IERPVVVLARTFGSRQLPERRIDPDGVVALLEIRGQVAVRHQVEHRDFHSGLLDRYGFRGREYGEAGSIVVASANALQAQNCCAEGQTESSSAAKSACALG